MADHAESLPTKATDIGLKQLRALANLPLQARIGVIAEGLPILLRSAQALYDARDQVERGGRIDQILRGHAEEEAAKILILLDYVRCPRGLSDQAQSRLRAFYDHGARLIYAQACAWRPVDVAMLQDYVDRTRASHFIEGYAGEYILPNWDLYAREARLYADLTRMDDGKLAWNDPDEWPKTPEFRDFAPTVIRVTRSLAALGAYSAEGLAVIHEIWSKTPFIATEDHSQADQLTRRTVNRLVELALPSPDADNDDVREVCFGWQMPMYAIDVTTRRVELEDLRSEQDRQVYGNI